MKKSLIALAALATVATAAQAQSSVTIYGIVDSGIARATGVNTTRDTTTAVVSGALSTSRLGFKGSEDLGGGLKTNFVLENEFYSDLGTSATKLFNRGSYLELENTPVGLVRLGYQNRLDYAAVASNDPFGASNVGGFVSAGYLGSRNTVTTRVVDAVTLQSAKFNGLSVAYQRQIGGNAGNTSADLTNAYNADYTNGKFRLNVTHVKSYGAT
jgi:predicted porin